MLRVAIALVFLCAVLVNVCHAQVGVHVYTAHFTAHELQNVNVGAYYIAPNGTTVGIYRNSYDRPSAYAGYTWQAGRWGMMVGAATGYNGVCPRVCKTITPMLVPSVKVGLFRLSIPNLQGVHVSVEAIY